MPIDDSGMDSKWKLSLILFAIAIPCLIVIQCLKFKHQWMVYLKGQRSVVDAEKHTISSPPKYDVAIKMPKPSDSNNREDKSLSWKDGRSSTYKVMHPHVFDISGTVQNPTIYTGHLHKMNSSSSRHLQHLPTYNEFMKFCKEHKICNCHSKDMKVGNT